VHRLGDLAQLGRALAAGSMIQAAICGQSLAARTLPLTTSTVPAAFDSRPNACIMHIIYQ
jgi:hypothetical protein